MVQYIDSYDDVLSVGDHVAFDRGVYSHHAIYIGSSRVINLTDDGIIENSFESVVGYSEF